MGDKKTTTIERKDNNYQEKKMIQKRMNGKQQTNQVD